MKRLFFSAVALFAMASLAMAQSTDFFSNHTTGWLYTGGYANDNDTQDSHDYCDHTDTDFEPTSGSWSSTASGSYTKGWTDAYAFCYGWPFYQCTGRGRTKIACGREGDMSGDYGFWVSLEANTIAFADVGGNTDVPLRYEDASASFGGHCEESGYVEINNPGSYTHVHMFCKIDFDILGLDDNDAGGAWRHCRIEFGEGDHRTDVSADYSFTDGKWYVDGTRYTYNASTETWTEHDVDLEYNTYGGLAGFTALNCDVYSTVNTLFYYKITLTHDTSIKNGAEECDSHSVTCFSADAQSRRQDGDLKGILMMMDAHYYDND